jgi:phosphoribosylanthranilate isomerase
MPLASPLFHVKVCGVTTPEDAALVARAGADAIGLNFVPGSPRCLPLAAARHVAAAIPAGVLKVGVFAGMPAADILRVVGEVGLEAIQLHGHMGGDAGPVDPPATCVALRGLPVIRAVRLGEEHQDDRLAAAREWLAAARALGAPAVLALVDARVSTATAAGRLGGTGARVDWPAFAAAQPLEEPVALAGGLGPDTVAEAIRATGVRAVDTASGVESAPGRKDAGRVLAFVAAARSALGLTG